MPEADLVVLGKISEPYGVQGWVRVHAFGDDPLAWGKMPSWWLGREGETSWREVKLVKLRAHGDGLVVLLEGVADRTGAEALKGMLVGAPRQALPTTGKDEYYWGDLVGLEVVNTAGESLGKVAGLIETGANDVMQVVDEAGTERLLPFVSAVVLSVAQDQGVIQVEWGLDW